MAATESTMLELGTIAPDFALTDVVTGKTVHRDDFRGKPLLVLFICAHCPYVKHIEKSLGKLGADYAGKPVGIVAISANDAVMYPDDGPEGLKQQAKTNGFVFPYLHDESQNVAKAYKAACTPDPYLFDSRFSPGLSRPVRCKPAGQRSSRDRKRAARCNRCGADGQAGFGGAEAVDWMQHQVEGVEQRSWRS